MAAMKPRTGDGPMEVTKEGRSLIMGVLLEAGPAGGSTARPRVANLKMPRRRYRVGRACSRKAADPASSAPFLALPFSWLLSGLFLYGHADPARPALRPGPAGHRRLRAGPARASGRADPAAPGHDVGRARRAGQASAGGGRASPTGTTGRPRRTLTLALVPIGYADGVPRRLNFGGRMVVLLGGRLRPVVGRVCMDQVVVDCGPAGGEDEVAVGERAVLFGPGKGGSRPRRTGRTSWARSTTRSSPGCTGTGCALVDTGSGDEGRA